ncbi:MAG: HAD family phosphatase [bacterium]
MQNKCVIFDMDGVLADTAPYHLQAWQIFGDKYKKHISREFFFKCFGMKNAEIFPMIFGNNAAPGSLRDLSNEKEAIFRTCIKDKVSPLPGIMSLLSDLQSNKIITAIGSSAPRENVELVIEELGLNKYIKGYICSDDVKMGKPDPEIFLKTAEMCGVPAQNCLVIEDAVVGVKAANSAGMVSVAVTNTASAEELKDADLIIESAQEFDAEQALDLLKKSVD